MAKVNFHKNKNDFQAAMLGSLGFSTEFIRSVTKLTHSQVLYRLGKAHIKRTDYRNGNGQCAALMLKQINGTAQNLVKKQIRITENGN